MVNNVNSINGSSGNQGGKKKEPPYAELFKEHGVSPQEVKQYLEGKGITNPQQLQEALRSGENPFNELFESKGISQDEVKAYEQKHGNPAQNASAEGGRPPGPPPGGGGPPPEILQELQQYGLQPQGSLEADKAAIAAAKAQQQQGNNGGYNTNFLSSSNIQGFKTKNNLS